MSKMTDREFSEAVVHMTELENSYYAMKRDVQQAILDDPDRFQHFASINWQKVRHYAAGHKRK